MRLALLITLLGLPLLAAANPVWLFGGDSSNLQGWKTKNFKGRTLYQLQQEQGSAVIHALSRNSASALYRKKKIDLRKTPYLNWSWRVDHLGETLDPHRKAGDDYVARVYVVVRDGLLPWQTRALNYVWAHHRTDRAFWPNPFTDKAVMLPVRTGKGGLGVWQRERVNVADDLRRIFGEEITELAGVAIMTDSDNAGGSAEAYYADIHFSD